MKIRSKNKKEKQYDQLQLDQARRDLAEQAVKFAQEFAECRGMCSTPPSESSQTRLGITKEKKRTPRCRRLGRLGIGKTTYVEHIDTMKFRTELGETIFKQKYASNPYETWEDKAHTVVNNVCGTYDGKKE